MEEVIVLINGMKCKNCSNKVTTTLNEIEGVQTVDISLEKKMGKISFDPSIISGGSIIEKITKIGFKSSEPIKTSIKVTGMKCKSCSKKVTDSLLENFAEILKVEVDLPDKMVHIFSNVELKLSEIHSNINNLGFKVMENETQQEPIKPTKQEKKQEITVSIPEIAYVNLKFFDIENTLLILRIQEKIEKIPGVSNVEMNANEYAAYIEYDSLKITPEQIISNLENYGYTSKIHDLKTEKVSINIGGMTCSSCSSKVESHLSSKTGITKAVVNVMTNVGLFEYLNDKIGPREIINEIESLGFTAELMNDEKNNSLDAFSDVNLWQRRFFLSLIFCIPVVLFGFINHYAVTDVIGNRFVEVIIFLLATPVHFYGGFHFHYSAIKSLKNFYADMNVLISLATNSAYIYSVLFLFYSFISEVSMRKYFFETSSMIITLMNLGKYLESIAKKKTSNAISELVQLQAKSAILVSTVLDGDQNEIKIEEEVKIELVQKGDVLKVLPGESVPVDGICIEGESTVDESMITGEDNLIRKQINDSLIGGTINHDGVMYMKVLKIGSATMLSQIVKLVKESQNSKVPIQKYSDRLSKIFIPIVIFLAFVTFCTWYFLLKSKLLPESLIPYDSAPFIFSLRFAISVLVICCPCALSLATPTAIMVACGVGAKLGVLIKSGESLESAHQISAICFDKTGTLTMGKPKVIEYHIHQHLIPKEEFFSLVYSAESNSQHPLAKSLVEYSKNENGKIIQVKNFISISGKGIECQINEKKINIGSESFLFGLGIPLESIKEMKKKFEEQNKTNIFVAYDQKLIGGFVLSDNIKVEAKSVVRKLKEMNIKVILLSGDRKEMVDHVAHQLGIHIAISDLLPAKKLEIIKSLQQRGFCVGMVGDGVNDAPSLAQSDVGIAIGAGSEVALESSDIVLVKSDLTDVLTSIDLSKTTFSRIKLNHFWALGYNVILIPLAMGLLYPFFGIMVPPIVAAMMMSSSSLIVLFSSLLLRLYKKPDLNIF